ncbi:hypothetical protein [Jannaschia faecimaris]|uniref:hypothetical protein n=1 Tax=Jannaschia faecimaris TaxID=1244108 RepID=UPI001FCDF192|nr:hypothetical protein [Jannaschia faecimaris]
MEEQIVEPLGKDSPEGFKSRVEAALAGMEALRQTVQRKLGELNAMTEDELKAADLTALQRDLGKAVTLAVLEEGKVSDALRQQTGGGGLDLDAARAAIRGRLDSIRAASDPGSVSGVAERE